MSLIPEIPADVARRLGYYVYAYIDPRDKQIFYVGKGKGRRALGHLQDTRRTRMAEKLREIRASGRSPAIDILAHGLKSQQTALRIEAAVIDSLGLPSLANRVRGSGSVDFGRTPLPDLVARYRRRHVSVREPAILIRISQLYRPGMSEAELYDVTRGIWKVGRRREEAKYAFAVFEGVVREVYEISAWLPAGSTFSTRDERGVRDPDRWEFVGRVASPRLRGRYVNRYVGHVFRQGQQTPFAYVNC